MKKFKVSPSNIHKIMTGTIGLTEVQTARLAELSTRKTNAANGVEKVKPLTDNMEEELGVLIYKKANPQLPAGVITYLKEWFVSKKYNRKKEFFSKFIEKGLRVETLAIDSLSLHLNEGVELKKNETYFCNEYVHGFPDVVHEAKVFDTKASWDIFSFPFFEAEIPDDKYKWQMDGYMDLTGAEEAWVAYTLINTPQPLIDQERKKLFFQTGGKAEDWSPEVNAELDVNYKFDDIPKEDRIRVFKFKRDQNRINQVYERVKLCREYIETHLLGEKFETEQ